MSSTFIIAIGSNRRHHLYGRPVDVACAAMEECAALGTVLARSKVITSAPMGAAQRRFANAVCLLESEFDPEALLAGLKRMEREFGRRPGRRWGDRVLDLDIVLWGGGQFVSADLTIPHPGFAERDFVLGPASALVPDWRDPISGFTLRQLNARLTTRRRLPR